MNVGARAFRYTLEVQPDAHRQSVVVRQVKARLPRLALASSGL
jgi:hypothetical protein